MSTAERVKVEPEGRFAFRTTWEGYRALTRIIDEGPGRVRIAFDGGMVELMSPGASHESQAYRLERIVEILTDERRTPYRALRSTRWVRDEAQRGLEPDACFYLTAGKVADSRDRKKRAEDLPSPDLAVEVDHSASRVDRASIYLALGVPEVWCFDGVELRIEVLTDGAYPVAMASPSLGISAADVASWVNNDEFEDDNDWARGFRAWVRAGREGTGGTP